MAQLNFDIINQQIVRTDYFKPVAESQNYLFAHFDFLTNEWTGQITAIFRTDDHAYEVLLDNDHNCLVPWEVLQSKYKEFYVSVFCGDLVTANKSRVRVYETGYTDDLESSTEPTPSIYAQILEALDDAKHNVDGGLFTDWID